jgi:cytochrome c oxidase assembly factor CtaG/ferredoxin
MVDAFLRSWPLRPWLLIALLVTAGIYLRGWIVLHSHDGRSWHFGRLAALLGGLAAIYLALASPIEPFAALLLSVHMLQHMLLMMVAAPLVLLAAPLVPLLRGLPRTVLVYWVAPLLSTKPLHGLFHRLTHPLAALPLFIAATWLWHLPPLYDLALRSNAWHYAQHLSFLAAALLFWYPVVRPYSGQPLWLLLPYLLLADLSNTVLSAVLTFSERVLYPYYAQVPRLGEFSVLEDQSAAGVLMWVPGSLAFLLPLFIIGVRLLSGPPVLASRSVTALSPQPSTGSVAATSPNTERRIALPVVSTECRPVTSSSFDLLRFPLVGRFLKWRHARLCLQLPMLLLAGVVIFDGLRGPQAGGMNLAGILPWIHWRGFLVLGLLVAGNVFCMGCPFMLPRALACRWLPRNWNWPRRLQNKWPAVLLIIAFLWAYEALALWDRPLWTAWIAASYFVAAFLIDGLFRGASFCKYLCPIGQFNFVQSLASPLEVKVRDPTICTSCHTKDCIRGRDGIPGCELHLFLPRKAGNMDCTACLDCVHACPHDNVALIAGIPAAELWNDRQRSGIGRFSRRPDIAALVVVLVFGAFANAAGMVAPVMEWQEQLAGLAGVRSPFLVTTVFYLLALVAVPVLAIGGAAVLSRWWGRLSATSLEVATRYAYALVPLGFGMWLAHYCFHFLTGFDTIVPVARRFAVDLGLTWMDNPVWDCVCRRPVAEWLLPLEILFLDVGLLLSLYAAYRLAPTLKALVPWATLIVLLFAVGVWVLFQPMQMRGTP